MKDGRLSHINFDLEPFSWQEKYQESVSAQTAAFCTTKEQYEKMLKKMEMQK